VRNRIGNTVSIDGGVFMKLLSVGTTSLFAVAMIAVAIVSAGPQEQPTPRFEVASIRPNTSGDGRVMMGPSPGRFNAVNVPLRMLLRTAFRVQDYQIIGGPGWMNTDRFDIDAKTDGLPKPVWAHQASAALRVLGDRNPCRAPIRPVLRSSPLFRSNWA
jgi:hypothetical protein